MNANQAENVLRRHLYGVGEHTYRERFDALEALSNALRLYDTAYEAVLAHAEGLRMDTEDDERVRLKLVALVSDVRARVLGGEEPARTEGKR